MGSVPKATPPQLSGGRSLKTHVSNFIPLGLPPLGSRWSHLPTPQVADLVGGQQEDVVGVERGGPGWHLHGLGVHLARAPHLEEADRWLGCAFLSPARATLQGNKEKDGVGSEGANPG